jgi:micrococcal nuclease
VPRTLGRAGRPPRGRGTTAALVVAGLLIVVGAATLFVGVAGLVAAGSGSMSPAESVAAVPAPAEAPADAPAEPAPADEGGLVPVVSVTDGDTIRVRVAGVTERVRVIGIDTPELRSDECYAQQAASKMQSLVQSKQVRLTGDPTQSDRDRFDRLLRHVALPDGRQVAEILIAGGFGEEYTYDAPYAGRDAYRAAQEAAREAGSGIWGSGCRAPTVAAPLASGSCLIKGNIAADGERIYHLPGQRYYEVTRVSESKGERWFCTEQQAREAGWRAAKV